jgi:hypothetical protein
VPVLSCPKCPTKLKVPDGVSGNTRCPKCGTVFPVVKPAFEVVEEPAPRPAPKSTSIAKPAPAPASKKPDFEVVEEEPKKKRVVADDEDVPRKKRSLDDDDDDDDDYDDDEDDRPRSRKKRSRDDDEDDRRRKKKKKKRYADDDYDDDWQPHVSADGAEFAKGKAGAMLIGISFWLNLAAYGLLALYTLIAWLLVSDAVSGSSSPRGGRSGGSSADDTAFFDLIAILPGLIGLGAWLVGLVGTSIAIAGPRKARGMAITATVFAAVHLLFVGVTFGNLQDGLGVARGVPGFGKAAWVLVASTLPALDTFLPLLFYNSKAMTGDYIVVVIAGACEAARLIVLLFTLKSLASAARDFEASEKSGYGVMIVAAVMGGVALLALLVVIIFEEGKFKNVSTIINLAMGMVFFMYLAYTLMMLSPAIAAFGTKDACARRT